MMKATVRIRMLIIKATTIKATTTRTKVMISMARPVMDTTMNRE